ncbi:hypothetical protein [Lentzea sp. NPDC060358]|uniref:hypothetical protein n=1 Tax=Lentzea sp. NPDC060358 TaxID=3347103 RepID=UPI00366868E2
MVSERADLRRRYESEQLLNHFEFIYWRPTLDGDGRPVPFAGSAVEITPELVAAIGRKDKVLGENRVVPAEVARDVALALRGQAVLAAHAEDAR